MLKRPFYLWLLILGFLGLVGCSGAVFATWRITGWASQASENVFEHVDDSLIAIQQRVAGTGERIAELKFTTEEIQATATDWAKTKAGQEASARLQLKDKAENLDSGLERVDEWLEITSSSVQFVARSLAAASSAGLAVPTDMADTVLDEIGSIQAQLNESQAVVASIRRWATDDREEKLPTDRVDQVVKLAARLIVTIGSVESRFDALDDKLTRLQQQANEAKATAAWWLRMFAIGITWLIAWMTIGQVALCYLGWQGLTKS